eukprot:s119_g85.t1
MAHVSGFLWDPGLPHHALWQSALVSYFSSSTCPEGLDVVDVLMDIFGAAYCDVFSSFGQVWIFFGFSGLGEMAAVFVEKRVYATVGHLFLSQLDFAPVCEVSWQECLTWGRRDFGFCPVHASSCASQGLTCARASLDFLASRHLCCTLASLRSPMALLALDGRLWQLLVRDGSFLESHESAQVALRRCLSIVGLHGGILFWDLALFQRARGHSVRVPCVSSLLSRCGSGFEEDPAFFRALRSRYGQSPCFEIWIAAVTPGGEALDDEYVRFEVRHPSLFHLDSVPFCDASWQESLIWIRWASGLLPVGPGCCYSRALTSPSARSRFQPHFDFDASSIQRVDHELVLRTSAPVCNTTLLGSQIGTFCDHHCVIPALVRCFVPCFGACRDAGSGGGEHGPSILSFGHQNVSGDAAPQRFSRSPAPAPRLPAALESDDDMQGDLAPD